MHLFILMLPMWLFVLTISDWNFVRVSVRSSFCMSPLLDLITMRFLGETWRREPVCKVVHSFLWSPAISEEPVTHSLLVVCRGSLPPCKVTGMWNWPPSSSPDVKNEWNHTFRSPFYFTVCTDTSLLFISFYFNLSSSSRAFSHKAFVVMLQGVYMKLHQVRRKSTSSFAWFQTSAAK
jgi:hypothetical protein